MSILTHSLSPSLPPCISLWLSFCLCLCLTVCLSLFLLSSPLPHHLSFSFYFTHTLFFFLSTTFPLQPSHWPHALPLAAHSKSIPMFCSKLPKKLRVIQASGLDETLFPHSICTSSLSEKETKFQGTVRWSHGCTASLSQR